MDADAVALTQTGVLFSILIAVSVLSTTQALSFGYTYSGGALTVLAFESWSILSFCFYKFRRVYGFFSEKRVARGSRT